MGKWLIVGIVIWIALFFAVYCIGSWILDVQKKDAVKKWGIEERDYGHEKKMFRLYVVAFFVGIPVLLGIALWQELTKK